MEGVRLGALALTAALLLVVTEASTPPSQPNSLPLPPTPPLLPFPPALPPISVSYFLDWPGWRTWYVIYAISLCAIVAAISIYLVYLPASLVSIDTKDGAAAISLQPHFTTDRIGQIVLGRQQGEGVRRLTPRLLRPVRMDLKSCLERTLDQAAETISGDKMIFECITMDDHLRDTIRTLKGQTLTAIDDFLSENQLHLPNLVVHLVYKLIWSEDDALVSEISRQVGVLAAALVQAKLYTSVFSSPAMVREWVSEHVGDLTLRLIRLLREEFFSFEEDTLNLKEKAVDEAAPAACSPSGPTLSSALKREGAGNSSAAPPDSPGVGVVSSTVTFAKNIAIDAAAPADDAAKVLVQERMPYPKAVDGTESAADSFTTKEMSSKVREGSLHVSDMSIWDHPWLRGAIEIFLPIVSPFIEDEHAPRGRHATLEEEQAAARAEAAAQRESSMKRRANNSRLMKELLENFVRELIRSEDLLPIQQLWKQVFYMNLGWLLFLIVVGGLAVATATLYDVTARNFFYTGGIVWVFAMFVQVLGTLRFLQYRAERLQEKMLRQASWSLAVSEARSASLLFSAVDEGAQLAHAATTPTSRSDLIDRGFQVQPYWPSLFFYIWQVKATMLNLFPGKRASKLKDMQQGDVKKRASNGAEFVAIAVDPPDDKPHTQIVEQLEMIVCAVALTARKFILAEAKSISPAWLWNLVLGRFLESLLNLFGSDEKVIELLEIFGQGEWPFVVQGMFPDLPLTVQLDVDDPADLPVEVDAEGFVTRCGEDAVTGGVLFEGDKVLRVNGDKLLGRSLEEMVRRQEGKRVTLDLAERPLEQAIFSISRASLTELRQLAAYMRVEPRHPANRVERNMLEKGNLQMVLLEDPATVKLLARRLAAARTSGYALKHERRNPFKRLMDTGRKVKYIAETANRKSKIRIVRRRPGRLASRRRVQDCSKNVSIVEPMNMNSSNAVDDRDPTPDTSEGVLTRSASRDNSTTFDELDSQPRKSRRRSSTKSNRPHPVAYVGQQMV